MKVSQSFRFTTPSSHNCLQFDVNAATNHRQKTLPHKVQPEVHTFYSVSVTATFFFIFYPI